MCTISRENPVLQVAKEDIEVYKRVYIKYKPQSFLDKLLKRRRIDYFRSAIEGFIYRHNKTYTSELEPFKPCIHNFVSGKGFYSYQCDYDYCNVKCIIPKGANYYLVCENDIWIYHSDKIKIVSVL